MALSILGGSGFAPVFPYVATVVGLFVVLLLIYVLTAPARRAKKKRDMGHDPATQRTDVSSNAVEDAPLASGESRESRLADLDALLANHTINADEYAERRRRITDS